MRVEISLGFRRILCQRCGERRIVGVACPTCGELPDPREVDPDRQRRVRLALAALQILEDPPPQPTPDLSPNATDIWDRVADLINTFLAALMAAVADASREREVLDAVKGFRQLEADVAAAPRLRPWIDLWTAVKDVLSRLASVVRHYLAAVAADMPIEAQREAQLAQAELDAAADPAATLSQRMDAWQRAEAAETVEEGVAVLAQNAFRRSGANNLLDFDRAGYVVYERITGQEASLQGSGIGLNIIAEQARGPYDEARIWSVARDSFQLLARDEAWLAALVGNATWRDDLKAALEKLWDAGRLQAAAFAAVRHDRQAVRVILDLGQDLVESVGKRYVASLIAASKKKPYAAYRDQSAGALLVAAGQMGFGGLVAGVDRALRIASAHDEFALENDEVVLMDNGREVERILTAVLVDRVLAGVETTLALGLATFCGAIKGGIELETVLPDLDSLGVAPEDVMTWVLASSGWRDVQIRVEDGRLMISGIGDEPSLTMAHVAALFPHMPGFISEVAVVAETASGRHELRGPADSFRTFQAATEDIEKQARHVELMRAWVRDGHPLMDESQARKVLAALALQTLASGDVRVAVHQVRRLMETARRLEDPDLADALTGLIGGLRDRLAGLDSGMYSATLDLVTGWAGMRVAMLMEPVATQGPL